MIVVIPVNSKDGAMFCKNLQWMQELDGKTMYRCLLAYPDDTDAALAGRMKSLAEAVFADVHVFTYPETMDRHWPAGANWAWQSVARYIPMVTNSKGNSFPFEKIYPANEPWLWLEADAIPLKPKWLDALADEYKRGGKPFMGHIVKQMGHMNGVGIYPNDVAEYARRPFMAVQNAWDVVMREETIDRTHNANHLIQHCWVLINGEPSHNGDGIVATFRDTGEMHRILDPNAVLFHRCKDGSLIDCLMQKQSVPPPQPKSTSASVQQALIAPPTEEYKSEPFPKAEIFIVTYHKDAEFLKYCLFSIKEFAAGFTGVTVVCPDRDVEIIEPICREWGPSDVSIELFQEPEGKGMVAHMAIECLADQYVKADYVLHFDSDCIFTERVSPADYFVGGKPVLLIEAYERFKDKHPGVMRWQVCTSKALGRKVEYETMRRHPAVHPVALYGLARLAVVAAQKQPFWDWAISGQNAFPQDWSEYNLLGSVALEQMHNSYHWIDCGKEVPPKDKLIQFWSHGGLDRPTDTGPFVPETPRTIIKRILKL